MKGPGADRGLFLSLAKHCYEQCSRRGVAAVYGYPNDAAFPGRIRQLDWKRIGFYRQYAYRTSVREMAGKILRVPVMVMGRLIDLLYRAALRQKLSLRRLVQGRNLKDLRLGHSRTVPEKYDGLWDSIRSYEVLSLWKDVKYCRWRYDENPDHKFEYFFLERAGDIEALAVVNTENEVFTVCDIFVKGHRADYGRYLVAQICLAAVKRAAHRVTFKGMDYGLFGEIFSDFSHRISFGDIFCGTVLDETSHLHKFFDTAGNWSTSSGDSDAL